MDGGAVLQTLVLSLGVLALVGAVAWHAVELLWDRRLMLRREVLVQLLSGEAVKGVLWKQTRRQMLLKSATLYEPGAEPVGMDGDVAIQQARVNWVQVAR